MKALACVGGLICDTIQVYGDAAQAGIPAVFSEPRAYGKVPPFRHPRHHRGNLLWTGGRR